MCTRVQVPRSSASRASRTSIRGRRGRGKIRRGSAIRSVQYLLQLELQHCAGLCKAPAGVFLGGWLAAELSWSSVGLASVAAQQQIAGEGSSWLGAVDGSAPHTIVVKQQGGEGTRNYNTIMTLLGINNASRLPSTTVREVKCAAANDVAPKLRAPSAVGPVLGSSSSWSFDACATPKHHSICKCLFRRYEGCYWFVLFSSS